MCRFERTSGVIVLARQNVASKLKKAVEVGLQRQCHDNLASLTLPLTVGN